VRVVVTGATGNVGTSVLRALNTVDQVDEIVGLARRVPELSVPRVRWVAADVGSGDLHRVVRGADAVVHLAWLIRPARRPEQLRRANLLGTARVLRAVADEGVPVLLCASSVGAYAPGPRSDRVDESWPTTGVITCEYSRQKAAVERMLDGLERDQPATRVVRFRKALIFKETAGSEIARYFLGPFVPRKLVRKSLVPVVPSVSVQVVHTDDVAVAYRAALLSDVRGAFNLAAEPALDGPALGRLFGAKPLDIGMTNARRVAGVLYGMRLQPTPPGWVDLLYQVPLMSTQRAQAELGWTARTPSDEAIDEIVRGISTGAGLPTPPLEPAVGSERRARGAQ
jgi:nucleoside-diphosphate-sugar epimerase